MEIPGPLTDKDLMQQLFTNFGDIPMGRSMQVNTTKDKVANNMATPVRLNSLSYLGRHRPGTREEGRSNGVKKGPTLK